MHPIKQSFKGVSILGSGSAVRKWEGLRTSQIILVPKYFTTENKAKNYAEHKYNFLIDIDIDFFAGTNFFKFLKF
jgi:hypothetical protein